MVVPSGKRIFIVFDTETTGLRRIPRSAVYKPSSIRFRGSEVIQIGGLICDEQMRPLKLFCHYCDCVAADSEPEALATHKISISSVRQNVGGQYLAEVMQRWLPEFFYPDTVFVGYNVEFDMSMVAQTIANSPLKWDWQKLTGNIVPKHGRHSVDVATYLLGPKGHRRKLSSFDYELASCREDLLFAWDKYLCIETNCYQLLSETWKQEHNAFFDALNTYILWSGRLWKKKLV